MFALMNPPHASRKKKTAKASKKKIKKYSPIALASGRVVGGAPSYRDHFLGGNPRRTAKNSWFGNAAGHRAAAKKGWAKRRKIHGKKIKRASELRTPGGGRIFSVAANPTPYWPKVRRNGFMGINPTFGSTNSTGGPTMSRSKRRGGARSVRFNFGSISTPKSKGGVLDGLHPKNWVGVAPILGGVILDGLLTKTLSDKIPYTKKGLGNIALGLAGAGVFRMLGSYSKSADVKAIANGMFLGGVVGTLGCALQGFLKDGLKSLSLGDMDGDWSGFQGMGDMGAFITPQGIANAIPSGDTMSQYSLPAANAQFVPMLAPPQKPVQQSQVSGMSDNDMGAIGAVLDNEGSGMMGM